MLPKIEYPINEIEFKSLKRKVKFRPMLVKDEKILLMAKESNNETDIFSAIKQIVNNCAMDKKFNVDNIPLYELEYAFLNLRMQSVNNVVELSYHDNEDDTDYKFNVNIADVKIIYPDNAKNNIIKIGDNISLVLRYPPASLYSNEAFLKSKTMSSSFEEILLSSVDSIYDDTDNAYTFTKEELKQFLDELDSATYKKIQEFFEATPYMEYIITYKNKNGTERHIPLRTLNDFFIL